MSGAGDGAMVRVWNLKKGFQRRGGEQVTAVNDVSLTIAPGKFAEICGPLEAGQAVQWSFEADRALNFNVHYHVDKDVRYPAKKESVKRLQGDLSVDARQDYCWMWTNKTTAPTKLSVTLTRK